MDASEFTDADISECVEVANKAQKISGEPDDMRAARALIGLPSTVGPWSGALRAHAREILLRKEKATKQGLVEKMRAAERALSPLSDVARELLARDRAAEDIARAMLGLPPIKVEVVFEPARYPVKHLAEIFVGDFEAVAAEDFQRDGAAPLNHVLQAPTPPAKPDPTRIPLDAMLRFLCGHPQGARWMGPRLHAEVLRIARKYRPDAQVEHRYTAGMAASLLGVCEQCDPGSTWKYLNRQEQQDYLRLFEGLRVAVNQVPASGVRP